MSVCKYFSFYYIEYFKMTMIIYIFKTVKDDLFFYNFHEFIYDNGCIAYRPLCTKTMAWMLAVVLMIKTKLLLYLITGVPPVN